MAGIPIARLLFAMMQKPMIHAFEVDFRRKFASADRRGLVGASRQVERYAKVVQEEFGNPADAAAEFERIAALMRAALVESYVKEVEGRKVVPSYRIGDDRYSGGALLRALSDPSMAVGGPDGIRYLNTSILDTEARHWRRLNFGAQGYRAHNTVGTLRPVFFDSRVLFYVGSEGRASPAFTLPPGRFIDPRSGQRVPYGRAADGSALSLPPTVDKFFPGGGGRNVVLSGGIQGRHFIEPGFDVLAEQFGPALEGLFRKWSNAAEHTSPPVSTTVLAE